MPGRNKTPVQQAWEYAMNARGVKWVLVSNMIELRLYGFGEGTTAYEAFQLDRLTDPDEYALTRGGKPSRNHFFWVIYSH